VLQLKRLLGKVTCKYTDPRTGFIDYVAAQQDEGHYPVFEEAVCVLQDVDMGRMDERTRSAFCMNVYNLMITFAFIKYGIATTVYARSAFFNKIKCNVGGLLFTFNDLEHGVLRGNARHPYALSPPFGREDPRAALALSKVDCRLHFVSTAAPKAARRSSFSEPKAWMKSFAWSPCHFAATIRTCR